MCNAENGADCFSVITFWEVFNTADASLGDFIRLVSKSSVWQKDCKSTGKKMSPFSTVYKKRIIVFQRYHGLYFELRHSDQVKLILSILQKCWGRGGDSGFVY